MDPDDQMLLVVAAVAAGVALLVVVGKRFMPKDAPEKPAPQPVSPWERLCRGREGRRTGPEAACVRVHDVDVTLERRRVESGDSAVYQLWASAEFKLGRGPTFRVGDVGVIGAFVQLLGGEDVKVGDPAFDDQFTLRGEEPAAIARAFTEPVRTAMKAIAQNRNLKSDGRVLVLEVLEGDVDLPLLERCVTLLGELAAYEDPGLARLLRVLGGKLDRGESSGELPHVVVDAAHGAVRIAERRHTPAGSLSAWTAAPCPAFAARLDDGEVDGALPPQTGADRTLLKTIGKAALRGDGREVVLEWPSWPERDEALRAGVRFLDGLAAPPSAGAFR